MYLQKEGHVLGNLATLVEVLQSECCIVSHVITTILLFSSLLTCSKVGMKTERLTVNITAVGVLSLTLYEMRKVSEFGVSKGLFVMW